MLLTFFLLVHLVSRAQSGAEPALSLSLRDALSMVKEKNKLIGAARIEQDAVEEDYKDARTAQLPSIGLGGSYQRFSKVTLFREGLTGGHNVPRYPEQNSANVGLDASLTLFAGGRIRNAIEEQHIRKDIASLNTLDQTGSLSLQVVSNYLDILRLNEQDSVIMDQIRRAETRLKNIRTLYENQKVTRSDVLRAEVILANQKLSREQNENDISIAIQHLDVLLNLPTTTVLQLTDSAGSNIPDASGLTAYVSGAAAHSYTILRAQQLIKLQDNRIRSIRSGYSPTVQFYSAYGLNYPNYLGFPPVDQFYLLGFVGIRMTYNISSFYQNRHKAAAAHIREAGLELQKSAIEDEVNQQTRALATKYSEALDRISVAESTIDQTRVNYRIVSVKYFNQLALLTDLLDADNLYLESRFNLIRSQTDALAYYYRLLYVSGNL